MTQKRKNQGRMLQSITCLLYSILGGNHTHLAWVRIREGADLEVKATVRASENHNRDTGRLLTTSPGG